MYKEQQQKYIYRYFPRIKDCSHLQYDKEGLYSITHPKESEQISQIILNEINSVKRPLSILDCSGGLGGNTFSFSKYFERVTTMEIDSTRFGMLSHNLRLYGCNNVECIQGDSVPYLMENADDYNVYFIDPPWGIDYKSVKMLSLTFGNMSLVDIARKLKFKTTNKWLVFKLPLNYYNFSEFDGLPHKMFKVRNYYIVVIYLSQQGGDTPTL